MPKNNTNQFISVLESLAPTSHFFSTTVLNMDGGLYCVRAKNAYHEVISIQSQREKIDVKYRSARTRKQHADAYRLAFQLGPVTADDGVREDAGWVDYVETRDTCSVCKATPPEALTECMHVFCRTCIDTWLRNNSNCPLCRGHLCRYTVQRVPIAYFSKPCKPCKRSR